MSCMHNKLSLTVLAFAIISTAFKRHWSLLVQHQRYGSKHLYSQEQKYISRVTELFLISSCECLFVYFIMWMFLCLFPHVNVMIGELRLVSIMMVSIQLGPVVSSNLEKFCTLWQFATADIMWDDCWWWYPMCLFQSTSSTVFILFTDLVMLSTDFGFHISVFGPCCDTLSDELVVSTVIFYFPHHKLLT